MFGLQSKKTNRVVGLLLNSIGRGGGIRTRDPLHPMQVRYQAALRPDKPASISEGRALALVQMAGILPGVFRHLCMHHLFFHIAKQGRAAVVAILGRENTIRLLYAGDAALAQYRDDLL
jgi:hypothetical protein